MPITFTCTCGKMLRVADEHAGKRVKCPACNTIGNVPAPEPEPIFEVVEHAPKPAPPPAPPRPVAKPVDDDEDRTPYGVANSGGGGKSRSDDDDDDARSRDKPLPDFRLGSGVRKKKRKK